MARNPEYQNFLNFITGRTKDKYPRDLETQATSKEIGWWKRHQFRRAMIKARAGEATLVELIYLAKHGFYYPTTPRQYIKNH